MERKCRGEGGTEGGEGGREGGRGGRVTECKWLSPCMVSEQVAQW